MVASTQSYDLPGGAQTNGAGDCWVARLDAGGKLLWSKTFGGTDHETCSAAVVLSSGQLALAGSTKSQDLPGGLAAKNQYYDWLIVIVNADGTLSTLKIIGGDDLEQADGAIAVTDGMVFVGTTKSATGLPGGAAKVGSQDMALVRTDGSGNLVWLRTYGVKSGSAHLVDVTRRPAGGFAAVGTAKWSAMPLGGPSLATSAHDAVLIFTDDSGKLTGNFKFGGAGIDSARAIAPKPDGGYVLAGETMGLSGATSQPSSALLISVDEYGNSQWEKVLGGTGGAYISDVLVQATGSVTYVGHTSSPGLPGGATGLGSSDVWLGRVDATGTLGSTGWNRLYGGSKSDYAAAVVESKAGGFWVLGTSDSTDNASGVQPKGGSDILLLKTDANGNTTCTTTP